MKISNIIGALIVLAWVVVFLHITKQVDAWSGTGFFINSQGYIATAGHVVNKSNAEILVKYEGRLHKAKLIGINKISDVAIIKIDKAGMKFLPVSVRQIQGEQVSIYGYPGGVPTLHGKLNIATYGGNFQSTVYLNGGICSGYSGGPIINKSGEVIGVATYADLRLFGAGKLCQSSGGGADIKYIIKLAKQHNISMTIEKSRAIKSWTQIDSDMIGVVIYVRGNN